MAELLVCLVTLSSSIRVIHGTADLSSESNTSSKECVRFQPRGPSDGLFIMVTLGRLVPLQVVNNRLSVLPGCLGDAGLAQSACFVSDVPG